MAQFKLHAYDADVWIPEFRGLNQADVMLNPDLRYAAEAENVETIHGVLQPQAAVDEMIGEFTEPVETLANFHRRWYTGAGEGEWYICCSGGKFYQRQAGTQIEWQEMELPSGVSAFQSSEWSWVTYEINPEGSTDTLDVLLLTNPKDGMIMIVPPDRPTSWLDVKEHTWQYYLDMSWLDMTSPAWHINRVTTASKKIGVIERYGDRIWGCAIDGEPDMLMYSAVFDPTDWTANVETPEDGAGDILQPSWDGDKFYALKRFGDRLLAFKKNRIWQVLGTNPGEFTFQEQFGGGTEYFNTIAVDKERVFMGTKDGLSVYDGMSTSPYAREQVEQVWKTINKESIGQMCAALFHNRYYIAFPVGDSEVNNVMLSYDLEEGSIILHKDFFVETFLPTDDHLYFTSSTEPGKIYEIGYDSWTEGKARGTATRWVTPWMDFGHKEIVKGGFDLYFTPEVQKEAVTITLKIQTDKKTKTKNYTVHPLNVVNPDAIVWENVTNEIWGQTIQSAWGDLSGKIDDVVKEFRHKRLHFSGSGRRFRVIIETGEGVTAPWRLIGGIQLVVETDPD